MPITIKPIATIVQKWQTNAGAATTSYTTGIQTPKQDWATATENAANSWASGVSQAATSGRFARGVARAGSQFWQQRSATIGAQRYTGGIQAGVTAYSAGITPYLQAIAQLNLPAKLPTGDPGNIARVQAVDTALRQLKLSQG